MIAMTTSSSIKVKAARALLLPLEQSALLSPAGSLEASEIKRLLLFAGAAILQPRQIVGIRIFVDGQLPA